MKSSRWKLHDAIRSVSALPNGSANVARTVVRQQEAMALSSSLHLSHCCAKSGCASLSTVPSWACNLSSLKPFLRGHHRCLLTRSWLIASNGPRRSLRTLPHDRFYLAFSEKGGRGCSTRCFHFASASTGRQDGEDGSVGVLYDDINETNQDERRISRPQDIRVEPVELHKEVAESYLSYAISVLVGRALPDVRDGLKPVHRRILYAMHELGLSSKKPFKKCARVVGEVLGKFHPHGDTAVYDALVRMAQDFSLRSPLISGHGNFGSLDADPPAAMRYTECRLQALSEAMFLADLELDTVDFAPNFDDSQKEPLVLPARLPNLLLNGSSGIAVGMATNIPPHNLGEVVDALCALIRNPNATVQELMEHLPGPDFPTGGQILGTIGILEAYRTGRGKLIVRGKAEIEQVDKKSNRCQIVIMELPFQANKAMLVQKMAELVEQKVLEGISDIRDESDRAGMRVVVEVKRGANPAVVLNNLFKHTSLQSSFNCNMIGIVNGKPELQGLKEFLQVFLDFRCSVVERRAKYQLQRAETRDHIVKGILIGLENLTQLVEIVRGAKDTNSANQTLQKEFGLSHEQADALLGMTLRKLTGLERNKFLEEHDTLTAEIRDLKLLLSSQQRIYQVIEKESVALKREFSTERQTALLEDTGLLSDIDVIANDEALVILSEKGYIKRMRPDTFAAQNRGTVGKTAGKLKADDALSKCFVCRNHDYLLFFSDKGTAYSTRAYQIPESSRTATGSPLVQVLPIPPGERVTSVISVSKFVESEYLVMLTAGGFIKRTTLASFSAIRSAGIIAIQLMPGDELKWVKPAAEGDSIVMGSRNGRLLRVACDSAMFRPTGRTSRGVRSMRLKNDDMMAAMDVVPASVIQELEAKDTSAPWLLFVTENGFGIRLPLKEFSPSRLSRGGLVGCKFIQQGDKLVSVFIVGSTVSDNGETGEEVVLGSHGGILNRIKLDKIPLRSRRGAKGVTLMKLEQGDKVNSVSLVSSPESDREGETVEQVAAAST